jgi:splicing factor U2AF subunit
VGGLPCDWGEEQVKSLLAPHGALKAFNLVLDKTTGNSKGYCFCEFWDVAGAALAIAALDSKPLGNKYLTAKRALAPL